MSSDLRGAAASPLSHTLEQLALVADIRGDAAEAALLRRAAALVRARGIATDADLEPLLEQSADRDSGIDADVLRRLQHMYEAGAWVLKESAIADLPLDLRWLYESGAVTMEQLAALHESVGVVTAGDLAAAVEAEAVRHVPGLGAEVEYAIGAALFDLRIAVPRVPLGRAAGLIDPILSRLREMPGIGTPSALGSLRRGQDMLGDVEILAPAENPAAAIEQLSDLPDIGRILHRSARRLYLLVDRVQIGMRFPEPLDAGAQLLHLTGSREHLDALRAIAYTRGGRLTIAGYQGPGNTLPVARCEEDIYAALGLPFIPPEIRDGVQALDAAREGRLPDLVSQADIKGDLHMHTTWSDGRDAIEAMVATCQSLGYEYCAITDHSPRSAAGRKLSVDDVKRQSDEIAGVRERFPGLVILHGCEVDILPDGRLDMPDRVLEQLDIILVSLHEPARQSPEQLLKRYAAAMRHPLVHIVTHPSNRTLPYKPPYALDYDRLFEVAVETGTILEIDGAPGHLDMDSGLARRAVNAGVRVVIDSDAHRTEVLERQMRLGVLTARRGWVERRHVVNTLPAPELGAELARKRRS